MSNPNPMRLVNRIHTYPAIGKLNLWAIADQIRELDRRLMKEAGETPDNRVYLSSHTFTHGIQHFYRERLGFRPDGHVLNNPTSNQLQHHSRILVGLAGWQLRKRVYRLSAETLRNVLAQPLTDEHLEALKALPPFGIYIETPGLNWCAAPLDGVTAYLDAPAGDDRLSLELLMDQDIPHRSIKIEGLSLPLDLTEHQQDRMGERPDYWEKVAETGIQNGIDRTMLLSAITFPGFHVPKDWHDNSDEVKRGPSAIWDMVRPQCHDLMKLVAHVCGLPHQGDYRPTQPRPHKTDDGQWAMPVNEQPEVWFVDGDRATPAAPPACPAESGLIYLSPALYGVEDSTEHDSDLTITRKGIDEPSAGQADLLHAPTISDAVEAFALELRSHSDLIHSAGDDDVSEDECDDELEGLLESAGHAFYDQNDEPDQPRLALALTLGIGVKVEGEDVYLAVRDVDAAPGVELDWQRLEHPSQEGDWD